ncbi:MAG: glycine cleavage system protein GcvH [Candidatus Methanomethylicota archaeon]|nr:glycine cleavage system protein GcvH [Candidatus Culexmicrobium cathedralense]RLE48297.1 MAG: glycine cleavage system protein GcvH [Candidatus Verstraetearchaeota archaeon]
MKVNDYEVREELYYTKEHEWAKIEGELVRIGITDYAQKQLRDIVYVELPEVGKKISKMGVLGTVESVKAVSEVYSPLSGEVVEVNEELENSPELINQDPYGEGWIAVLKPSNLEEELKDLMKADEYAEYLKKEVEEH